MTQNQTAVSAHGRRRRRRRARFDAAAADLDALFAALEHPCRRVSRAARDALAGRVGVPRERLWALLARARRPTAAAHAIALLGRGERIDSMTWLLNAVALGGPGVREQACLYLARWGEHRGAVAADALARLVTALGRADRWLPPILAQGLWAGVRNAGGPERPAAPAAWTSSATRKDAAPDYRTGRTLLRKYVLPPRWPASWKLLFRR
jgi:hypothetical protein